MPIIALVNINWYRKLSVQVRWNGSLSERFKVGTGVCQGAWCLVACFFNVFMNIYNISLRALDVGCNIYQTFIEYLLYADDIVLMCPTNTRLQKMLDVCYEISGSSSL